MDDMVLQVSARDGEGVDDALVRLEVPTFGGGEVLGQMSRWHEKKTTAEHGIHRDGKTCRRCRRVCAIFSPWLC